LFYVDVISSINPNMNKMFKTALSSVPIVVKTRTPKKPIEKGNSSKQPAG